MEWYAEVAQNQRCFIDAKHSILVQDKICVSQRIESHGKSVPSMVLLDRKKKRVMHDLMPNGKDRLVNACNWCSIL